MTTRDEILSRLRKAPLTISELAGALGLARTAIVQPLQQLENDGLIQGVRRREKRAGKPAMEYSACPGQEDVHSNAYPAFAEMLTSSLAEQFSEQQLLDVMQRVGRKMGEELTALPRGSMSDRLKAATNFVDELGADTVTEQSGDRTVVRSYSCPLARVVRREPCVCKAVSAFFAEATGATVEQQCEHGEKLVCKFVIAS